MANSDGTLRIMVKGVPGSMDVRSDLASQGLTLESFDSNTLTAKVKNLDGQSGTVNVGKDAGLLNNPDVVIDQSPLSAMDRVQLGMVRKDATVYGQYLQKAKAFLKGEAIPGMAEFDAQAPVQEKRALQLLKSKFEDSRIVDGNFQVKDRGVWRMADSSNSSLADYGKDISEFIGSSGLNIMGAIAGGSAGATAGAGAGLLGGPAAPLTVPGGAIIGGALGSITGAMAGELAEEGTAIAISDGVVDPQVIANELMTEGTLGLVGELPMAAIGLKLAGRAAAKGITEGSDAIAKEALTASVQKNQRGFTKVASEASPGVKDSIAKMYSMANANISQPALRTALDSPENMAEVIQHSKTIANLAPNAPNPVLNDMGDILQDNLMKVYQAAQEQYGEVLRKVQFALTGTKFETNLADLSKFSNQQLSQLSDEAASSIKPVLNLLNNEAKAVEGGILKGGVGFNKLMQINQAIDDRLGALGAFKANVNKSNAANESIEALQRIRDVVDSHITAATKYVDLGPALETKKQNYGQLKDALKTIWGQAFSSARDTDFAVKFARGELDQTKDQAFKIINELQPSFNLDKLTRDVRVRQAAIETKDAFALPKSGPAAFAAGAAAVGFLAKAPLLAAPFVVSAFSPKGALKLASGTNKAAASIGSGLSKTKIPYDAAKNSARKLVIMANTSGAIHALPVAQKAAILKDKTLFDKFFGGTESLMNEVDGSKERILDAASQAVEQKEGQQ